MSSRIEMKHHASSLTPLQIEAWSVANASYSLSDGAAYRHYARELYERDLHDRIIELFADLDEQNATVDAILMARGLCRLDKAS